MLDTPGSAPSTPSDLGLEDLTGSLDRRELELLLRAEVGVEPALAHAGGLGEVADREALEALDGGELRGRFEDRAPAPLAVGAAPPRGRRAYLGQASTIGRIT